MYNRTGTTPRIDGRIIFNRPVCQSIDSLVNHCLIILVFFGSIEHKSGYRDSIFIIQVTKLVGTSNP